jgi:TPR repeat protein
MIFSQGSGVPIDTAQAFRWYHEAALQEDADAQLALGLMYARGSGVEQDVVRAVHWFRRAAIQGRSAAQAALGLMYETGRGIAQHDICAYTWFSLAAAAGSTPAQARRDALRAKMSNAQLAQGQAFASSVARAQDCADDETQASRSLVAQVQRSLAELGYLSESTAEPGVVNAETTLAVKAFQSGLGLKPTGRISEELLMLIRTRR